MINSSRKLTVCDANWRFSTWGMLSHCSTVGSFTGENWTELLLLVMTVPYCAQCQLRMVFGLAWIMLWLGMSMRLQIQGMWIVKLSDYHCNTCSYLKNVESAKYIYIEDNLKMKKAVLYLQHASIYPIISYAMFTYKYVPARKIWATGVFGFKDVGMTTFSNDRSQSLPLS